MKAVLVLILIVSTGLAQAAEPSEAMAKDQWLLDVTEEVHVGNGGDVVVCYSDAVKPEIESIELLDFYEARTLRGAQIDLGAATLSVNEKIELALTRVAVKDVGRAQRFRQWLEGLLGGESLYLPDARLIDIPDSAHIALPRSQRCRIEQIVVQRDPVFPEDFRYTFDDTLMSWLRTNNKNDDLAGLFLHELIYREARADGVAHSIGVRYLNSLISANWLESRSVREYVGILRKIGLSTVFLQGVWLDLTELDLEFHQGSDNAIRFGFVVPGTPYTWNGNNLQLVCYVKFYPDGSLQAFSQPGMGALRVQAFGREYSTFGLAGLAGADRKRCFRQANGEYDVHFRDDDRNALRTARLTQPIQLTSEQFDLLLGYNIWFTAEGEVEIGESKRLNNSWVKFSGNENPCYVADGSVIFEKDLVRTVSIVPCDVSMSNRMVKLRGPTQVDTDLGYIFSSFLAEPTMLTLGSRMVIEFYGSNVVTEVHGGVGFFDDGTVASGYLNQDTVLVLSDGGGTIEIPRHSQVYFDRAGFVTHVNYPD